MNLWALPGSPFQDSSKRELVDSASGIIFVANSDPAFMDDNEASLRELRSLMPVAPRPAVVFQYNKRDLADAVAVEVLSNRLNSEGAPEVEAVATEGLGVFDALSRCLRAIHDARKPPAV